LNSAWIGEHHFDSLGVKLIAGRDFNEGDRHDGEKVVIVSETVARRMFPNQDAVNRHMMWTDPVMKFIDVKTSPRRIVGIAADVDDEDAFHALDTREGECEIVGQASDAVKPGGR